VSDPYGTTGAGSPPAQPEPSTAEVAEPAVLVDEPLPGVRRVTLNRPEKRNALNHAVRGGVVAALQAADADPDVRVTIVRGAGTCFSAGYELGDGNAGQEMPSFTAGGEGHWPRHVTEAWMGIWDLAKPVIAQVHGWCLAGGSELATGCDLVYVAEDARIGYPAVRFGVPDMQFHAWFMGMRAAMEMMLTGDWVSGEEAARLGWANRAYPAERLEEEVLARAERIALVPSDLAQLNKRTVHRAMEHMGIRTAIRSGTELCALGIHQASMREFMSRAHSEGGLTAALQARDEPFGDYRVPSHGPGPASGAGRPGDVQDSNGG
jgi:enoyl-CoA hydratase